MKNIKIWFIVLILVSIFPTIYAEDPIIVKINEVTPLKISCSIDGARCTSSASCNSTIRFPNETYFINSQAMENLNNGDFRINLTFRELGIHPSKFECIDNNQNATITPDILATPSGRDFNEGQGNVSVGILIASLFLAFFFLILGFHLGKEDSTIPIAFLFIVLAIILGIYSLHLSFAFTTDILQYESLIPVTSRVYIGILWSVVSIFIISTVLMLISFIKELGKINDTKKFGENFDPITQTYKF